MADKRADLRRLAEAATPGPWTADTGDPDDIAVFSEPQAKWLANVGNWGILNPADRAVLRQVVEPFDAADAAYIAAVDPQTVLSLLDSHGALEARVAALEEALRESVEAYHQLDSLRSHSDDERKDGWFLAPFERCNDLLCADARALLTPPPNAAATPEEP